jgi:DNA-binding NarL/FixJ family response regulator
VPQSSVMHQTVAGIRPRVVLGQPHALLLEALESLLEASGFAVVARCDCISGLERCLRAHAPDVALVDTELVGPAELADLIRAATRALGDGRLVLLAPALDPALARESLALDVDGVVLKSATRDDVVAGLRRIAAGDAVYPAGWLAAARRAVGAGDGEGLSGRQLEVLELLAQGLPNHMIAERLFISKNTVKFHVAAIYQRLGVSNRVQAARALAELHEPHAEVEVLPHPAGWGGRPPRAVETNRAARPQNRPPARARTTRRAVSPPPSRP